MNPSIIISDLDLRRIRPLLETRINTRGPDADHDRISVLAPLGSAMLGYREEDWFEWPTPGGIARMAVRRVISIRHAVGPGHATAGAVI